MKRLLATLILLLWRSFAAQAQVTPAVVFDAEENPAPDFLGKTARNARFSSSAGFLNLVLRAEVKTAHAPAAFALPLETAEPARPSPEPKFPRGSRDDFRFQLGVGINFFRFQNSAFNATPVGIKTSVTSFLNNWFGVEGIVSAAFAPEIYDREHVKTLLYGLGPKFTWREKRWEPWLHGIVGGAHEQPQVVAAGRNALAFQIGGGADYRFNPRFSGRLEMDYVRSYFFGQSQNNYEGTAGIVLHF